MTTKGNIEWEFWRKHNEKDAGGSPYVGRDKLYHQPYSGGPWPSDIRDHYRKIEGEQEAL